MSIAVIVSTYNGEKYLREQLDSIIAQTGVELEVFIRDDGSTDNTRSILEEYKTKYDIIHVEYGQNVGYAKSFFSMLFKAKGFDFYAFSDQDDYWEPEKMDQACKLIPKESENIPTLYYSNLQVCDEYLRPQFVTNLNKRKQTLESVVTRRSIAGCTMVFNRAFYEKLVEVNDINVVIGSHDNYIITLCYAIRGKVICDENTYIKYRRHTANTSGTTQGAINRIKKELHEIKKVKSGVYSEALLARSIIYNYGFEIDTKSKKKLQRISNIDKFGISRLSAVVSPRFTTGNFLLTTVGKIKILFGLM